MDNSHFTDSQQVLKQLRQQMGMNRREFCETFDIPYRTVTEWELGNRNAPGYVLRFLEYYIRIQKQNNAMPHTKDERIETDRLLIRPGHCPLRSNKSFYGRKRTEKTQCNG